MHEQKRGVEHFELRPYSFKGENNCSFLPKLLWVKHFPILYGFRMGGYSTFWKGLGGGRRHYRRREKRWGLALVIWERNHF